MYACIISCCLCLQLWEEAHETFESFGDKLEKSSVGRREIKTGLQLFPDAF